MEFVKRFSTYVSKIDEFEIPKFSKSEYWKYQSKLIKVDITENQITLDGSSGCYIPQKKGQQLKITNNLVKLARKPDKLITYMKRKNKRKKSAINLLNYSDAFDTVMQNDPIADLDLAPYRINFKKLREKPRTISSMSEMQQRFFAKDKYDLNPQMIEAYYLYNIMNYFLDTKKINTVLEIGAGNGNFASLMYHSFKPHIIIVDLPETLCLSIPFITDLFPDAKILMPHESESYDQESYDFIFLTPDQIEKIKENSIDLIVNISSFQEMTREQIKIYFNLIQKCCKNKGYFLTKNRVEKIPGSPDIFQKETHEPVNRFSEYPWNSANDVMIYEICRLSRLVQLDDCYIRLEQIRK